MSKYVRCSYCDKRIDMDTDVVLHGSNVFCDTWCFTDAYGEYDIISEKMAEDLKLKIYDDDEDIKRLREKIRKAEIELKIMQAELAGKDWTKI